MRSLEVPRLRALVRNVMLFLSVRQFPTADPNHTLPDPSKMKWWIPTAARMLAFISACQSAQIPVAIYSIFIVTALELDIADAANNSCRPPLLHFSELYNEALDHIDLAGDYFKWQDPSATSNHFSYCQYPFILSINAKKLILTKVGALSTGKWPASMTGHWYLNSKIR